MEGSEVIPKLPPEKQESVGVDLGIYIINWQKFLGQDHIDLI